MTENGNDAGEWEKCRGRLGALSEAVLARETPTSPMIGSDTWTGNGGYDSGGSNSSDRSSWGGTSYGSGSAHIVHRSHSSHSELHGFARCDYTTVNGKDRVEEWMKFHSPLDGLVGSGKGGRNGKLAESTKVIGMEIWWRVENVVETESRRRVGKLVETESRQRVGTVVETEI